MQALLEGQIFQEVPLKKIIDSIKNKIIIYPDDTKIYPGHGPSSTIKAEKATNPFFKINKN